MTAWTSQAGQDAWVHSIIGDGGFFVDIGAHDGVTHSNSYALETYHGWSGICIEPDPDAYRQLGQNRLDTLRTDLAVSSQADVVTIMPSGIQRAAWPLARILEKMSAPPVIDYLSIDTEGYELQVLRGMDFRRWRVNLLTVEHNLYLEGPMRKEAIVIFLEAHGFEFARENVVAPGYGVYEDWFMHRSLTE